MKLLGISFSSVKKNCWNTKWHPDPRKSGALVGAVGQLECCPGDQKVTGLVYGVASVSGR